MAQLYAGYAVPGSVAQQLVVQCPSCAFRFPLSPAYIYPEIWPQNVQYSQASSFQYTQPLIQHSSPQNRMRSAFYVPAAPRHHVFNVNQQYREMTNSTSGTQCALRNAVVMNDMLARQMRDVIIDILGSPIYKYGIAICQLMVLLKQSCANYNIILPSPIVDNFKEFLRYEMADYVEVEDDLCRYRRPVLSIQEESISNSTVCGKISSHSETPPVTLVRWQASQRCSITPAIDTNTSYSSKKMEKFVSKKNEIKEGIMYKNVEEPSFCLTKFHDNKSKHLSHGVEGYRSSDDADKTMMMLTTNTDPVVTDGDKKCSVLHEYAEINTISEHSYTKNNLTEIKKRWKKIFIGDLKELIKYLRMVDNYFRESGSKFTLAEFKEMFGELSKRWEFCDIDLVEMDIINVVHDIGFNEEPVLSVNPAIREIEFPELGELAKQIYTLLSKLLQSVSSVKVEVIARTVNFGLNSSKTIEEKYALLWEVLSDFQFQDIFVVDVLQKQNKERGFDVMVRLNPNLDLPGVFAQ
ncbi:unnamed protein product [Litomosoides sigmodontis]|uniref:Uncharacterized protein n=1 Tax=Litomosoides sigmodontis TaxID=42156 RepID=A0A3P6UE19_LITSI|nr:unnamed protein product [Litomosoides sigmodontis]